MKSEKKVKEKPEDNHKDSIDFTDQKVKESRFYFLGSVFLLVLSVFFFFIAI